MVINLGMNWENFYKENIVAYIKSLQENPFELITLILDLAIVAYILYKFIQYLLVLKNKNPLVLLVDSCSFIKCCHIVSYFYIFEQVNIVQNYSSCYHQKNKFL